MSDINFQKTKNKDLNQFIIFIKKQKLFEKQ